MIKTVFALVVIALAIYLPNQFRNTTSPEDNYEEYCASCHGDQLESFVDRKWIYGNSWNEVYYAIATGYPDDGMPGYDTAFTKKEINELTDYILFGIEDVVAKENRGSSISDGVIESEELSFRLETVIDDLDVPWGMDFLPDGQIIFTERDGDLFGVDQQGSKYPISGAPQVKAQGQGGLLDVAVHPDFTENQWIYISFSKPNPRNNGEATTAIIRAKLEGDRLTNVEDIFEAQPYLSTRHHYGSKLQFDQNGFLYFSVGDRGRRNDNPQSLDNHCGKIHRIFDDGTIPSDNPFVDQANAMPSIYSYGHRNPQGITMHPSTGEIWEHEHGPRGGDEINRITPGTNYGWPIISYGINYNGTTFTRITQKEGLQQPEHYWVPSIAPCGMTFVDSDKYPEWQGDILTGSLRFQYIHRTKMEGNKIVDHEKLLQGLGRIRAIEISPDGYVYVAVEGPGKIVRLIPE